MLLSVTGSMARTDQYERVLSSTGPESLSTVESIRLPTKTTTIGTESTRARPASRCSKARTSGLAGDRLWRPHDGLGTSVIEQQVRLGLLDQPRHSRKSLHLCSSGHALERRDRRQSEATHGAVDLVVPGERICHKVGPTSLAHDGRAIRSPTRCTIGAGESDPICRAYGT